MSSTTDTRREVAGILLQLKAVSIDVEHPFRYASGRTGPIYCDNRVLISYPAERRRIVERLVAKLEAEVGRDGFDVVAGAATAGIPWAAWIADRLDKPMVYVRGAAKDHGRGQRIEGRVSPGQRAIVVEDLVTTGGSALSTVEAVREAGCPVAACLVIFSYELPAAAASFASQGVPLLALTGLPTLLEVAAAEGYFPADQRESVQAAIAAAFAS